MKIYSNLALDNYPKVNRLKKVKNFIIYEYRNQNNLCLTIEFNDRKNLENIIIKYLKQIYKFENIKDNDSVLVIGLGNNNSTPDSLGPKTIENVIVTSFIEKMRNVYTISPNVMGNTGIETITIIESLVRSVKPKFLIVVDALASSSIKRVNQAVEISNMGISPGSGITKKNKKICKKHLHIPVISIGIPTVVDASTIVLETIKNLDIDDKQITNILTNINFNHLVTPKDIDFQIDRLSYILGSAINKSLHKWLTNN